MGIDEPGGDGGKGRGPDWGLDWRMQPGRISRSAPTDVPMAAPIEVERRAGPAFSVEGPGTSGPAVPSAAGSSPVSFAPWATVGPWPPVPRPWPPEPSLPDRCELRQGCYRISFVPGAKLVGPYHLEKLPFYAGTMRVDGWGSPLTVSGDLYVVKRIPSTLEAVGPYPVAPLGIPIYPRSSYASYLRVTGVQRSPSGTQFDYFNCHLTLTAEEYTYTQPPMGSFNGTFPAPPGTRTVTIVLHPSAAPPGFSGPYFAGSLYAGGVEQGTFTMGWVSRYFRRATVEIDTLVGAVPPRAVPARSGSGTEDIRTAFAGAGWDLTVAYDRMDVPVPAGVNPNQEWSAGDLHALMKTVRNPSTDLDREWRLHLLVVPAKMGSGRGRTYDSIDEPREGVATYSDDGYEHKVNDSLFYGTAANKKQRDVARAFLRSACHELGHGFNQIHQTQGPGEGVADNSIMTSTDMVADLLGSFGVPGQFPDDIALEFNHHVRHHLVHFPDIVVRPGGMTYTSGHFGSRLPEADRDYLSSEQLELRLEAHSTRISLGEPLGLHWQLVNNSNRSLPVPSDIRLEAQQSFITVTDPNGVAKPMPSFVIETDRIHMRQLNPGESLAADAHVYWGSMGFAFKTPGRHVVELRTVWADGGVAVGVRAALAVWVKYPMSRVDDEAADLLLNDEVGMYVALGGGAPHLSGAEARIARAVEIESEDGEHLAGAIRGYDGLLPQTLSPTGRKET